MSLPPRRPVVVQAARARTRNTGTGMPFAHSQPPGTNASAAAAAAADGARARLLDDSRAAAAENLFRAVLVGSPARGAVAAILVDGGGGARIAGPRHPSGVARTHAPASVREHKTSSRGGPGRCSISRYTAVLYVRRSGERVVRVRCFIISPFFTIIIIIIFEKFLIYASLVRVGD